MMLDCGRLVWVLRVVFICWCMLCLCWLMLPRGGPGAGDAGLLAAEAFRKAPQSLVCEHVWGVDLPGESFVIDHGDTGAGPAQILAPGALSVNVPLPRLCAGGDIVEAGNALDFLEFLHGVLAWLVAGG